jgi:vacuolar-type H+-ATPase subunit E/Vma4
MNPGSMGARTQGHDAPLQPSISDDPVEAARALASEARDAASSLSADFQQTAKAAARAAKAQASEFASDVGHEMSQVAEQQKVRGVEAMQGFARAINSAASELERQSPMVAGYVRNAAKQVDGFSNNIRGRNVTELMHAATDLAKAQPVIFLAGAMAAGFALSRFLKSSAPDNGSHAPRSGSPSGVQRNRPAAGSQYQSGSTHGASGGVGSTSRGS